MKRKLLFAALFVAGALGLKTQAQTIWLETDLTSQFSALTETSAWTAIDGNHPGTTATDFCPEVAVNGLGNKPVREFYYWNCATIGGNKPYTGDVFYATVTGLAAGTYTIELYGAAAFTYDRGFGSTAFTGDLSVDKNEAYQPGDKIVPSETVSTGVTLYAQSEGVTYGGEIPIYYAQAFPDGAATVTLEGVVVGESGTIKIGMNKTSTSTNWHVIQLKSVIATVDAAAYLQNAVNRANALEGTIPTAAWNALKATVGEKNKAYTTGADYKDAADAIDAAVTSYSPMVAEYAKYKAMYDAVTALRDVTGYKELTENAHATLVSAIEAASGDIENAATAEALSAAASDAISALKAAGVAYAGAAKPTSKENPFDLTFMLTNPDLSIFTKDGRQDGWYNDQTFPTQNSQVMQSNNSVANTADNTKFAMYEYWSNSSCATSGYTVYTKVTLPEGTYEMDALCMTGWGYAASSPNGKRNITFSAGDVDGTLIVTSTLEPATLEFIQDEESEVKIGLKAHEGNTCNWMGIGYVKLFKMPDDDTQYAIGFNDYSNVTAVNVAGDGVEESEGAFTSLSLKTVNVTVVPEEHYYVSDVTVTYTEGEVEKSVDVQNPSENVYAFQMPKSAVTVNVETAPCYKAVMAIASEVQYATFVAPFEVEIPAGVRAWIVNSVNAEDKMLEWEEQEEKIAANTPVVVYSTSAVEESFYGIANFTTEEADGSVLAKAGLLTGVLAYSPTVGGYEVPAGSYVLQDQEEEGVGFYQVDADSPIYLEQGKAFLTVASEVAPANIKGFFFPTEAEATAIAALNVLSTGYEGIYNAAGMKVNGLQKGLNIVKKGGKSYKIYMK